MRIVWLAVAAMIAVACGTMPVSSSSARPVPPERIHAAEFTRSQEGFAFLVVTRDKGLRASVCQANLYVDGTLVADLRPSEQVRLFVEEGEHVVGVRTESCFGGASQVSVTVTRAKPVLLRISAGHGEGITIQHSAF